MSDIKLNFADVSAIIPCYRCRNSVQRAVQSVANQTLRPAELILVDDCSADDTLECLYQIQREYGDWIVILPLTVNGGAGSARNAAWDISRYKYIAFLDADDAWHPKKIEIQYQYMESNQTTVLCGHQHKIILNSEAYGWDLQKMAISKVKALKLMLMNPFVTPSVMLQREINYRFMHNQRYMEDFLLWQQIILDGNQTVKLSLPLVAIFKPMYGASGLSSHLWEMAKSDVFNYWILYREKRIGFVKTMIYSMIASAKFMRRMVLLFLRKIV